jgi:hypothetical protein
MSIEPAKAPEQISHLPNRRDVLGWAGLAAAMTGVSDPVNAAPTPPAAPAHCRVAATRLDDMVAEAFPLFNHPAILPAFDPAKHGARHDVDLHRLTTTVVLHDTGERLAVTGLLALPAGARTSLPVVSWQHGTILSFDQVPSRMLMLADPNYRMTDKDDSLETLFNVQRFAAQGFAVIAADYVGKGPLRKGRGEAYAVKGVTVDACMAILDEGTRVMRSMNIEPGGLFLNGWSQGALNTQWLHQELRRRSRPIVASAVQSPFNDLDEALRFWTGERTFPPPAGQASYPPIPAWVSLCIIITLGSYQVNEHLPGLLDSAIRPEFRAMAAKFWNDYALDFDKAKPFPSASDLLVPGFFDRFTDERNSAFLRRLAATSPNGWRYDSPIRFHYGLVDEGIHPAMVGRALTAGGAQASGIAIAGGSHRGTFIASLYGEPSVLGGQENVVNWFLGRAG